MATDKTGRESLVAVVKGTFGIPTHLNEEPKLLEEQVPLVMCDEFSGEPGFSAPLYEIDFASHKPRCDVLLNGSAYAPGGKPVERVTVGLKIGSVNKSFDVVGNRTWKAGKLYQSPSAIEPFVKQPISYDVAFGGVDRTSEDPTKHRWHLQNHAGIGYYPSADPKALDGKPLPHTEEIGRTISTTNGNYKPMAFGPVGRSWQPRIKWAGTYDEKWLAETSPFLPADFDDRYFQAAPGDQQTEYLRGGEEVVLLNLTAEGRTAFRMPGNLSLPILFALKNGEGKEVQAVVDTVAFEPDQKRFSLVWRARWQLRRNLFEVMETVIGRTQQEHQQRQVREERTVGKNRFTSLSAMSLWAREKRAAEIETDES